VSGPRIRTDASTPPTGAVYVTTGHQDHETTTKHFENIRRALRDDRRG
jgi:hypothetical protein